MAVYLTVSEVPLEFEGCGEQLRPGVIGLTDEIHGPDGKLEPQCKGCTLAQDRRLGLVMIATFAGMPLELMDEKVSETLKLPEFAEWRGLVDDEDEQ